jgi:hypothetical protein
MKLFKLIILLFTGALSFMGARAQNVSINILTQNSGQVSVGGTVAVEVTICNTDAALNVPNYKLRPRISVPSAIVSIPASGHTLPSGWTITANTGSQITLSNGTDQVPAGACRTILILMQGNTIGGPSTVNGNLLFSNGVAPGTATGTATAGDASSDNTSTSTVQVNPGAPCNITGATSSAPAIACGATTTTLTVTAVTSGTTGALEYSVNGGAFQSVNTFTVPAGSYTAVVREVGTPACNATAAAITVAAAPVTPIAPTLGSVTQPTCAVANGSFTITNYDAAFTYTVTPSAGVSQSGAVITAPAGTYTVTATLGACTSVASSSVTVNAQPATPATPTQGAVTQPTCTVATGSFSISNYNAAFTYSVSPSVGVSQSGAVVTAPAGTYTVTATLGACTSLASASVTVNAQPATPATPTLGAVTQPTCSVPTGSFSISNYNASYTYAVSPSVGVSQSGAVITAPAGTYTVTATLGACSSTASSSVTVNAQPATPATPTLGVVTQPTCSVATGSFSISNYNAAFTYAVSPSVGVSQSGAVVTAPAGTYTVTATLGACTSLASASATVNAQPATPAAPGVTVVNACGGTSTLTATGVTGSVLWSNGATTLSITVASLPATTYTVTQTVSGCTSASGSGTTGAAVGCTVITTADPALGQMFFTTLSNAVQNANTLLFPPVYKLNVPFYNLNQLDTVPNGTIQLKVNLGTKLVLDPAFTLATAPLSNYFTWTSAMVSDSLIITGTQIATVPADFESMLTFQVKGSISCAATVRSRILVVNTTAILNDEDLQNNAATLQYNLPVTVTTTQVNVTCNGANNGIINIVASPGTTLVTRNAANAIVGTSSTVTGLAPGVYTITATAQSEAGLFITCTNTTSVTIVQPAVLAVSNTASVNNVCNGGNTGSLTVVSTGGTAPYTYTIAGPTVNTTGATTGIFTGLLAGTYTVTSTDAKGCTATVTVTITQPTGTAPDISLGSDITGSFFASSGTSQTIVYNVTEIAGNPSVGDTLRITNPAGFTISFNNSLFTTTVGATTYLLDNARWKIDNSNPAFTSIILTNPSNAAAPGTILCNERVNISVTLTRNTTNISTFTLSARLRRSNGELNLNNNLNSIILTAE